MITRARQTDGISRRVRVVFGPNMSRASAMPVVARIARCARGAGARARSISCREEALFSHDAPPPDGTHFDVVVAGNGPIGAAVARRVCERAPKASVLVLDSERLTSGSDDLGRIVRPLDAEGRDDWTKANVRSIEAFEGMAKESGIEFFTRQGSLAIGREAFVERGASRLRERGVAHERAEATSGRLAEKFPFWGDVDVPEEYEAVWDDVGGFVNPHAMRAAQNALMRRASGGEAKIVRATCERVESNREMGTCSIRTSTGAEYTCGTCVLACGCYTEPLARECGLLESDKDEVKSFGEVKIARRTVLLAEVLESEVRGALASMPTMKYEVPRHVLDAARVKSETNAGGSDHSRNEAKSVYVLPPIYYPGPTPSAGWYVKIGGGPLDYFDKSDPSFVRTERELEEWMAGSGDEAVADQLHEILFHMFPKTNFQSLTSKACAYSTSPDGAIKTQILGAGENVVAVAACQGKGAGPADSIGVDVADIVAARLGASS